MTFIPGITKHILLPVYKRIRGNPVFSVLDDYQKFQWLSPEELQVRQWQKLKALLQFAYSNTVYYHQQFKYIGALPQDIKTPEDFRKLPYLTKELIRASKGELITLDSKLYNSSTSGSTGEALWFSFDYRESVVHQALFFLGMDWAGLDIGEPYAKLWGVPMKRKTSRYHEWVDEIKRRIQGCLFLSVYNISEDTLPEYVARLKAHKPKVLESYVSPLRVLGQYLLAHPDINLQLEAIVTSSETLYDQDREFINKAFQCPIFNRYGSTEFGNVAQECDHHQGLHIFTEHAYIECLQNNQPVQPGEKGELVITSLDNYGMPFIRYRIGDYGEISDNQCTCGRGFPLLKSVDGRVFDIIVAPNGRFLSGTYWTILFKTVDGIRQFQIVQDKIDNLDALLVVDATFKKESLSILEKKICEQCGTEMKVSFKLVDDIPLTSAGKRKFIISKVPVNFGNG